jgi:polysaccharide biosynthesis transport protein
MNLNQAFAIFWNRKTTIGAVFIAVVICAFISVKLVRPQYAARAQIYINLAEPNAATNNQVPGAVVRSYINTQVEAVRSVGTATAVVVNEQLANDPSMIAAFKANGDKAGSIVDWIAGSLLRSLEVTRLGASDIISVSYRSEKPETAARMANAFADAFVRRDIEMRAAPALELFKWHEERLRLLRAKYAEVEGQRSLLRLEAIRRGDVDAAGAIDPATSLASVLATARSQVIAARSSLELARSGQNPPPDNPEVLTLRKALSDIELSLRRETQLLGPTHRRIQALTSNAQQLQDQINGAVARLRADMVADRERELAAAEKRVQDANAIMTRDEFQRHDQSNSRAAATALDRELESLRGQIDTIVQRRERSAVESAAVLSNMAVLARASPPTSAIWPRVPLVMTIAAALGIAFGFVLAFLKEMLDRRVRCVDDLTSYIEAPLLGRIGDSRLSSEMTKAPPVPDRYLRDVRLRAPALIQTRAVAGG